MGGGGQEANALAWLPAERTLPARRAGLGGHGSIGGIGGGSHCVGVCRCFVDFSVLLLVLAMFCNVGQVLVNFVNGCSSAARASFALFARFGHCF